MKSVFELTVKEIKQWQKDNAVGGLSYMVDFAEKCYDLCRRLESCDKKDEYLEKITSPFNLWILPGHNEERELYVVGESADCFCMYSINQKKEPYPMTSVNINGDDGVWFFNDAIYKASNMKKTNIYDDYKDGKVLKIYKKGYFNV